MTLGGQRTGLKLGLPGEKNNRQQQAGRSRGSSTTVPPAIDIVGEVRASNTTDDSRRPQHTKRLSTLHKRTACCREKWLTADRTVAVLSEGVIAIDEGATDGITPLMLATACDHLRVVEILLDKGANVAIVSNDGVAALHSAAQKRSPGGVEDAGEGQIQVSP